MKNKNIPSLSLRKLLLSALVAAPVATLPAPLWALPADTAALNAQVVSKTTGVTLTSTSATAAKVESTATNSVVTWADFGAGGMTIGAGDTLTFDLPSTSSAILNLVTSSSTNPTNIAGTIQADGSVYIANKNGITIADGATVNAAGLGLSTHDETLAVFNFQNNGTLAYTGTTSTGVTVEDTATINVGTSGTVTLAGQSANVAGAITGANLLVKTTSGTASLSNSGALTVTGGNVTVTTTGGAVQLAQGGHTTIANNLTVTSNGGAISIGAGGNLVVTGTTATLDASGSATGGAITQSGNAFTVGTGTTAANLNLTSSGTTKGAVTLTGVGSPSSNPLAVTINAGATSITGGTSDVVLNASTVDGNLTVSTTGNITSGGNVAVKSGSSIALTSSGAGKNVTFATAGAATFGTLSTTATGSVTVTAGGNVSLPQITATNLSVTTSGAITQTNSITATGTTTFDAGTSIALNDGSNSIQLLVLKNAPNGASLADNATVTLGNGTAATGNVSLNIAGGNGLVIGQNSAATISVGGAFSVTTAGGAVSQNSDNTTISGASTYALGAGSLVLDGSGLNSSAVNNQYGQINVTGTNALIVESTGLNIGALDLTGNLIAYSKTAITNSDKAVVDGTTIVGAGTAASPGSISLAWANGNATSSNEFTGAISIMDELNFLGGAYNAEPATPAAPFGLPLASSIAISNQVNTSFALGTNVFGTVLNIPVTLTAIGTGNINAGVLNTTGTVTLAANDGSITATNAGNQFSNLVISSDGGAITVSTPKDLTVTANLTSAGAGAVALSSTGNVTLGSISSAYTGTITVTAGSGGKIWDSNPGIAIFGPVALVGPGGVAITQAGHNFGGVSITTTNSAATLVEGGTLRLTNISTGSGNVSLSSSNGNVIQTAGTGINTSGAVTINAVNGAVTLNQGATNTITGSVGLTAMGNSVINQTTANQLKLSNVTVSAGTLTVDASGTGAALVQTSGSTINAFGATTITNTGANAITLANAGNRFGALTVSTGSGAVSIKELTTANLAAVTTTGTLSVESETGDVIDSGTISSGAATFKGANITLDGTGTDFGTVSVTATGNVNVVDNAGNLVLGASTVAGTFQVSTPGNLTQSGTLNIDGNTTLLATGVTSLINLGDFMNRFGAVRFTTGSGGATINEGTSFNLRGGSFSTGNVSITTGGDFVTSGTGGSSINGNLTINAIGTIIPGAGSLLVTGTFTVNSASTKDLSALSKSGNLNSKDPVDQGTGDYVAPSP